MHYHLIGYTCVYFTYFKYSLFLLLYFNYSLFLCSFIFVIVTVLCCTRVLAINLILFNKFTCTMKLLDNVSVCGQMTTCVTNIEQFYKSTGEV